MLVKRKEAGSPINEESLAKPQLGSVQVAAFTHHSRMTLVLRRKFNGGYELVVSWSSAEKLDCHERSKKAELLYWSGYTITGRTCLPHQ